MITLENIQEASKLDNLESAVRKADGKGLYMEFGVHTGFTIRQIAKNTTNRVYGFDSFEGLPEAWHGLSVGHFACEVPTGMPENVSFVKGLFQDTLPDFVKEHKEETVSFIHIDCDLYSSTKCVFDNLACLMRNETLIAFDEIFNYGENDYWRDHEFKAFNEFLETSGYECECLGVYGSHQAVFRIYK